MDNLKYEIRRAPDDAIHAAFDALVDGTGVDTARMRMDPAASRLVVLLGATFRADGAAVVAASGAHAIAAAVPPGRALCENYTYDVVTDLTIRTAVPEKDFACLAREALK